MAFESLADRLQDVFKKLRGKGKLSEQDVNDAMREVRMAQFEANAALAGFYAGKAREAGFRGLYA